MSDLSVLRERLTRPLPKERNVLLRDPKDALQIALHSYDGCAKGCPGCVVDRFFKNKARFKPLISTDDMRILQSRTLEYFDWFSEYLDERADRLGEGARSHKIEYHSYTFRFGNHSELPEEHLMDMVQILEAPDQIFSTAPANNEEVAKLIRVHDAVPGKSAYEIVYDPFYDDVNEIRAMIMGLRKGGIFTFPEVVMTRRLFDHFSPEKFVAECIAPIGDIGTMIQLARYTPARSRGFRKTQMIPIDEEIEWMNRVLELCIEGNHVITQIPLGSRAVDLLAHHDEYKALTEDGFNEELLPEPKAFSPLDTREAVRDNCMTSLYVDHELNVFTWSEAVGNHILDENLGFDSIGNLRDSSFQDIVTKKGGGVDRMVAAIMRNLMTNAKCTGCRYQSFCAPHGSHLFRRWAMDDGEHCYGYLPIIRTLQENLEYLRMSTPEFPAIERLLDDHHDDDLPSVAAE
ncbi:MAG: hypothetical protein AAF197_08675 [Pseudomonadota bacterium]